MAGGRIDIEVAPDLKDFPNKLSSGLKGQSGLASSLGRGLGLAVAAGTTLAAVGLKQVIDLGNEYQGNLNELQAVTRATGLEMSRVGDLAKELGSDLSLPGTSAADAAAAMKELAKGGLDLDEAMTAAKGTLQLAAAAQVDAARAAEIQSDALNQFGLSADKAAHVADVLANAANAASGEVTDIANALKYVGPVAKTVGADIDSVATAIGLIATQGIRGEQAGTSLRGMIASLAAPSKPAANALADLGVEAFTTEGKFVGLRTITEQLSAAQGRMSEAAFATAAATAFGNEGMTVASALASTGAKAYDDMAVAIGRSGGAADVAASKMQGLGGALEGFRSQAETTGIEIYEAIDGPLERLVRAATTQMDSVGKVVVQGLETAIAAGEVYGPRLADAIRSRASVVAQAGRDLVAPIAVGAVNPLNEAVNTSISVFDDFTDALGNAVKGAKPVADGIGAIARTAADGDGPVSALGTGVELLGDGARIASALLIPLGKVIGALAEGFADLPGPIQTAVVAMGLVAAFRNPMANLGATIRDKVTAPFQRFNETLRLQSALLTGSTGIASAQVGRLGLAFSALEKHVPVVGRIADSYRDANTAAQGFVRNQSTLLQTASGISGQYAGLASTLGRAEGALRAVAGTAAGTASALGTGLRSAASGLVGMLGGPFGAALAGVGVGLSLLASEQERAAAETNKHSSSVKSLSSALRESNGLINASVRETKAKDIADNYKEAAEAAKRFGISQEDLVSAALKQGDAYDVVRAKLQEIVKANTTLQQGAGATAGTTIERLNDTGVAANRLLGELSKMAGDTDKARASFNDLNEAVKDGRASMLAGTDSGRELSEAMGILSNRTASADDRARALKDALDALSGGTVDLEAAQFRVQDVLARLGQQFDENVDKAQGWGTAINNAGSALINADGSINGATENGRRLRDVLDDLTSSTADVAQRTYDMAISQGESVPAATEKARAAAQSSRASFIALKDALGLTTEEMEFLADRAGLVPDKVAIAVSTPGSDTSKQELFLIKAAVDRVPAGKDIHMQTISAEAEAKLNELGFKVQHMPDGTVTIAGNTKPAQDALNSFLQSPATKVVTVVYTEGKSLGIGSAVNHDGNYLKAYASGGFNRLTPMAAGVATIVPPNTWRVVGDRMVDDEAYIPINNSWRSQQILARTASEMGFDLIKRFAVGGVASRSVQATPTVATAVSPTITNNVYVRDDQTAHETAAVVSAQQAWEMRVGVIR